MKICHRATFLLLLVDFARAYRTNLAASSGTHVGAAPHGRLSSMTSAPNTPKGFGSRARRRYSGGLRRPKPGTEASPSAPPVLLKRSRGWACVRNCGACCYLAPHERPDLQDYLPVAKDYATYLSMAGEDGWCKHFDHATRSCLIYDDRPRFCRVEADTFHDMYGVQPHEMDTFCRSCCEEQIGDVYGTKSREMGVFMSALASLDRGEMPTPETRPFGDSNGVVVSAKERIRDWGIPDEADRGSR